MYRLIFMLCQNGVCYSTRNTLNTNLYILNLQCNIIQPHLYKKYFEPNLTRLFITEPNLTSQENMIRSLRDPAELNQRLERNE